VGTFALGKDQRGGRHKDKTQGSNLIGNFTSVVIGRLIWQSNAKGKAEKSSSGPDHGGESGGCHKFKKKGVFNEDVKEGLFRTVYCISRERKKEKGAVP